MHWAKEKEQKEEEDEISVEREVKLKDERLWDFVRPLHNNLYLLNNKEQHTEPLDLFYVYVLHYDFDYDKMEMHRIFCGQYPFCLKSMWIKTKPN